MKNFEGPPQFTPEEDKPKPEKVETGSPKLPGGSVPEWSLWESRVAQGSDGQMKETGVRAPDGTYHKLQEGERFVINKGERGDYEAVIIGPNGEEKILRKSAVKEKTEREQADKDKLEALRKSLGITSEATESGIETRESRELNEKIKVAAEYLNRLDQYAEFAQVDPETGAITYEKPKLEEISDDKVKEYQKKFTELLKVFSERNKAYMEEFRRDPHVLDVKEVAGAIVATYDSSKGVPKILKGEVLSGDNDKSRGKLGTASENYLGLAVVDLDPERRKKDNVSPTVSAVHELNHYMLSVSDYLMSQDESLHMLSAYRKGRTTTLYGEGKDRVTTQQAFWNDKEKYAKMLGRDFDLRIEMPRVETQLSYLDELHSSFLQRKVNWFNAQENVYSTKGEGKHWELVGDHPDDIDASKKLLGYLQGFYTLDKIREAYNQRLSSGLPVGEGQKIFMQECADEFRRVGSLIGAARTIKQTETLVAEAWKTFIDKHSRVATSAEFTGMLDQWEKGAGVENLRSIILEKK